MSKRKIEESIKRAGIEYGTMAAIYLFLVNVIINNLLEARGHDALFLYAILWICSLLLISSLFPYGVEKEHLLKDRKGVAKYAGISFTLFFSFFATMIGAGIFFFTGSPLTSILKLVGTAIIPIIISSLIFYYITIWLFESMETENKGS